MNRWFRMYHEFATDPKVQMMSEADQRRFVMVLCLRCSNGDVTLQDQEVAFQLRISNEEYAETKARFVAAGLIDDRNIPTAWDKRQCVSDSSTARVSRHRHKSKTSVKRYRNIDVTPPDTDTDTDTEKNKNTRRFKPPEREEVEARIIEMGYRHCSADGFINFYGSKNWMVGKNKMSDWRKALAGWEARKRTDINPVMAQRLAAI